MRTQLLSALVAAAAISCGPSAPTTTTPTNVNNDTQTIGTGGEVIPPEVPATRPKSLVLVARAQDLGKTIDAVDAIAKLPRRLRQLLEAALASEKASFVQLSGAFDVAVSLDSDSPIDNPKFHWAFSVPVRSADEAADRMRQDGAEVRATTPGSYRIRLKGDDLTCDVGPAADVPGRAVCSEESASVRALSAWMMRGLPSETRPADLWVRFEAAALKTRYLPFLREEGANAVREATSTAKAFLGNVDAELLAVPDALLKEGLAFGEDVDSLELSFKVDAQKPELRGAGLLTFKSKTAWITDVMTEQNDRPQPAPEVFFRLPKDAVSATWGSTSDPKKFTNIRRVAHKATELAVSRLPIDAKERAQLVKWVDAIPSYSGTWVSASGFAAPKPPPKGDLTAKQAVDAAVSHVRTLLPWSISGGQGDPEPTIAWLSETNTTYKAMVAALKRNVPKGKQGDLWMIPDMKFQKNPPGLPKGSAVLDMSLKFTSKQVWDLLPENESTVRKDGTFGSPEHPKGPEARAEIKLRVAVVPDANGRFWFGVGTDPDLLNKELGAVREGAPAQNQISTRTDLDVLKSHKGFGGFINYGSALGMVGNALSDSERKEFEAVLATLPNKGQAPIFILGGGKGGAAPTLALDIVAPKAWVDDLGAAIREIYKRAGGPQ